MALLRLGVAPADNPGVASFPWGPADLVIGLKAPNRISLIQAGSQGSDAFKAFLNEYADAITPAGCLSNHGGGLQDDGQVVALFAKPACLFVLY